MLVREAQTQTKEDPRITRTRKLLTQALNELLREKSFQSITVSQIAERATLNRVTFYAHFEDKFALLEYAVRESIREQIVRELPDGSTYSEENLRRLIKLVAVFLGEMGRHCPPPQGQMQPVMEKQIKSEIYDLVLTWVVKRRTKRNVSAPTAEQTAMVASWAIYGSALQWSQQGSQQPLESFVTQVLPLIATNFAAVAPEKPTRSLQTATGGASGFGFTKPALALV